MATCDQILFIYCKISFYILRTHQWFVPVVSCKCYQNSLVKENRAFSGLNFIWQQKQTSGLFRRIASPTDIPIVFLSPFRSTLDGVFLLYLIKEQTVTTKVAISCSTIHSRLRQQKDVKIIGVTLYSLYPTPCDPSTPWIGCLVVVRTKLGAWKRVKTPKPNSFNIHLLNSIMKPSYNKKKPHHLLFIDVHCFLKTDCKFAKYL